MKGEKKDVFDFICETPLRCFLTIFVGSYLLWWLILDGPAKWDAYFKDKKVNLKDAPVLLKDPFGLENNKK